MPKNLPPKIQKAIAEGRLIPFEEIMRRHSKAEREAILERARHIKFAMILRGARRQKRLSQDALAKKMRVKREFVSRIESGRQNVTLETLYRIGEVLGKEVQIAFK